MPPARRARARLRDHPAIGCLRADICDREAMAEALADVRARRGRASRGREPCRPVDHRPGCFRQTNVVGTYVLLEAARAYWAALPAERRRRLPLPPCLDRRGLRLAGRRKGCSPRSRPTIRARPIPRARPPSDHLARAWHRTYGLPVDRHQLLQQLRAVPISREADPADDPQRAGGRAAAGLRRRARTCATGSTSRTMRAGCWPCSSGGRVGETYNIGGAQRAAQHRRRATRSAPRWTSSLPAAPPAARALITFVTDRPGHDARYAIDATKLEGELGWAPRRELRERAGRRRCAGISTTRLVASRSAPALWRRPAGARPKSAEAPHMPAYGFW